MPNDYPPAPPAEAFRNSVLGSLVSPPKSPSRRKRPRNVISNLSHSVEETQQTSLADPPTMMRRSTSLLSTRDGAAPPPSGIASHSQQASSLFGNKPFMARRRSTLFDSLPRRTSSSLLAASAVPETNPQPSFLQRFSQNSTLLGEDISTNFLDGAEEASSPTSTPIRKVAAAPSRSSLFGAVMEKLAKPAVVETGQNSSPEKREFKSPSGKSIMNFMNKITSPFRFQSPRRTKRKLSLSSPSSLSSPYKMPASSRSTPQRKRSRIADASNISTPTMVNQYPEPSNHSMSSLHDDENWKEAPMLHGQAEILDWALPSKLQVECHPPSALAHLLQSREWQDALRFWQYTSMSNTVKASQDDATSIPPNVKRAGKVGVVDVASGKQQDKSSGKTTKGNETGKGATATSKTQDYGGKDPAVELASHLIKKVRKVKATANSGDGNMDPIREWQQAFRSLYFQWYQQIQAEQNIATALLDYYFYCVAADHVVLFRVDPSHDDEEMSSTFLEPRVLISSSGEPFLHALRDAHVENMVVLKDAETSKDEDALVDDAAKKDPKTVMSPTVKADLEALRKAQHFGEVAGADISIKIRGNRTETASKAADPSDSTLAVTIVGYDNVAAFFEVYFNRLGNVHDEWDTSIRNLSVSPHHLPRLVAPKELGPFLHASMKSLQARPVQSKRAEESISTSDSGNATIRGTLILPSITRQVVGLVASRLAALHPPKVQASGKNNPLTDAAVTSPLKDDALQAGSHYVVLHVLKDEDKPSLAGIKNPKQQLKRTGLKHSTILFNGVGGKEKMGLAKNDDKDEEGSPLRSRPMIAGGEMSQCQGGTSLQLIVWDVSRTKVAACKVGRL